MTFMTLQNRINIFMFVMLALLIVPIVSVGYMIINEIIYRLNEESLAREVENIETKIREVYTELEANNFLNHPTMVATAQSNLLNKLRNYKFGKTGYLYILDANSKVILHKDYPSTAPFNFDFGKTMLQQNRGTLQYEYRHQLHFGVFLTFIEWDWLLVVTITQEEMFGGRVLYVQFVLIFCGFIFFCVLLLSSVLTKGTSKKISSTLEYLKRFEGGYLEHQIPVVSRDEIGTIQNGINAMITKVAAANRSMLYEIEQRKQAEVKLQQAKEAAEQAQQIAESANRAKSVFLANMSHELRTPLNGILGYTQIFKRDKNLTPKQQEGIQIIHRSGEHLLTLINDVLDLSKIEAGKLELITHDFRFPEFLKNIADLFKMQAEQRHIQFIYELGMAGNPKSPAELPVAIHADEKRLRQILLNLLSNALKFTKQGQVTFQVDYQQGHGYFTISDTGTGIAADQLEAIFLPFQQANNAKNYYVEGTGLGLSISKRLVNLMGGPLKVSSTLGQGSQFGFKIPLPSVDGFAQNISQVAPNIIGYRSKTTTTTFKILVVDDKWENRIILVNLLTDLGFQMLEAVNGVEALTIAQQQLPELIITDLMMPVMDGFELAKAIRHSASPLKEVALFAASASVFDYHQNGSREAGCNEFIAKPIQSSQLLTLLGQYLPLEWNYETPTTPATPVTTTTLIAPSPAQLKILSDLIMRGNIKKIIEHSAQLEQQNPQLAPFVEKVCQMTKRFEIAALKEFIKEFT